MTRQIGKRRTATFFFAAAAAAALALVVAGSAAPPRAPLDRQALAVHLTKTKAPRFMTTSAQSALRFMATKDRELTPARTSLGRGKKGAGGAAAPLPFFTNVRVNDPAADSHQVDQTTQSETAIAVSGSKVAIGYNDSQQTGLFLTAGTDLSGYAYSTNGGASFTDGGTIPNAPAFINLGDPWLTKDRTGAMYYSMLAIDGFVGNLDIAVAKSTNGGKTWSAAEPIYAPGFDTFYLGDKDAMTAGPDPSAKKRDNVYVTWDDFVCDAKGCFQGLPVARSTDGGSTWELNYADKIASDEDSCSFAQYIGAQPFVDPTSGALYVAAEKITVDDPTCEGSGTVQFSEWIFRSTDGGQTFGAGVKIADVTPSVPDGLLGLGPGQFMRNLEFPTLAMLEDDLYVAWNDGGRGPSHIRLAKSTNGGQSWSLSWATQGSNDEVQPALTGDSAGLHLAYYRRNHDNTLDVFVANSRKGHSFNAKRVTTKSSPGVFTIPQFDPIIAFGYMGDYIANMSDGTHQYLAWGDNRDRVTNFMWPQGRNDPNVYFAKQ